MTTILQASYQPLQPYVSEQLTDPEETPNETGVMIHVVPESTKARWNHIKDLDSFFTRMYKYHQKHGFTCMMLQEVLELYQFLFVVFFSTFLLNCVDYPILFRDKVVNTTTTTDGLPHKITVSDAIIPLDTCAASMSGRMWIVLLVAVMFWSLRVCKVIYNFFQFQEIKAFYNSALKINDSELDNLTWHEVQKRIREVQREQQMCIHKQDLSELDIYHRILRFKNYMVAMVNKSLLPVKINVPYIGQLVYLSQGLKFNLELLLFWGPFAPFQNNWHLKEDYKKLSKRKELAEQLSKHILWLGILNFLLCPLILLWQVLYSFFNYAEMIKREPGILGLRCWSLHGKLYLRHFNELDHELNARLSRAYRPASKYMTSFTSPILTVIAKNITFLAGAPLAVLLLLTVYDEDVLTVEHVLTAITAFGAIVAISRSLIPDENAIWCPEKLITSVLAHVHYLPDNWKGQAHTQRVRDEFAQLFQYKFVYLLEELLSPIITPFVLCFYIRNRAIDIVDFYRNFTVEVVGVGDVCSFAQMDIRRHGNATWQTSVHMNVNPPTSLTNQYDQAEDGKTELSLVHFTLTNPDWRPPEDAENFVTALRDNAKKDASEYLPNQTNPLYASIHSVSSLGIGYSGTLSNMLRTPYGATKTSTNNVWKSDLANDVIESTSSTSNNITRGGLSRAEGPLSGSDRGLLHSLTQYGPPLGQSVFGPNNELTNQFLANNEQLEFGVADMSLSTLYLHELHHQQMRRRNEYAEQSNRSLWQRPHQEMATSGTGGGQLPEDQRLAERRPLLDLHPLSLNKDI